MGIKRALESVQREISDVQYDLRGDLIQKANRIANLARARGAKKRGPLWIRPGIRVRTTGGEIEYRVGYFDVRARTRKILKKHLNIAKRLVLRG